MEKYVIKIDNNYYAGPNKKYRDMYNISGGGPLGAKHLTLEEAENLKTYFSALDRTVEIEEYDAQSYLEKCLKTIIEDDINRDNGVDCGYAIRNNAKNALEYLKQI